MMHNTVKNSEEIPFCRGCFGEDLTHVGEKDGFDLLRCHSCKTVVVDPYPSDAELNAYYQDQTKTEDYLRKRKSKLRRGKGRVKQLLAQKPPGKKFLDIGCNVGFTVVGAHQLGLDAYGIDIDNTAVNFANTHFKGMGNFEATSVEALAARGDTFDMVYMSEVIEHVRDPDAFMAAVATLLRENGVLYLTCPDGAHFGVPKNFSDWGMVTPPQHLTYFSRTGMKHLLTRHGLEIQSFRLAFKPGIKVFARKIKL